MKKIDANLNKLALSALNQNDKIYIVGGYIRNDLMNGFSTDIDLCGTLSPFEMIRLGQSIGYACQIVNEKLGTVLLTGFGEQYEYTPLRREIYAYGGFHKPDSVEFVKDLNIDVIRRDFTVNSIYYDIIEDKIIDPFQGFKDIKRKLLRCIVSPRYVFSSDGLRILRLVRLACELDFQIERKTYKAAKKYAHQLKDISKERIIRELKLMITSDTKNKEDIYCHVRVIKLLNSFKLWKYIFNSDYKNFSILTYGKVFNMYKNSKPENRFNALLAVIFYNIYRSFKFNDELIIFYLNSLLGEEGLRLKKSINDIKSLIYILRDFTAKNQSAYDYNKLCINYNNLSNENKEIIKSGFDMNEIENNVINLFDAKVPFKTSDINITSSELIDMGVANKNINKLMSILMFELVSGTLKNNNEEIVQYVKNSFVNNKTLNQKD